MLATAPAFTVYPSIFPFPRRNAHTYTANDGVVLGGSVTGRRWLLSGNNIGTGVTINRPTDGTLILEVTATGSGGTTVVTSDPLKIGTGVTLPGFLGVIDQIFSQNVTDDLFGGQIVTDRLFA